MDKRNRATTEPSPAPLSPEQLEYHTPSMSAFDRPIDNLIRRADTTKRVVWFIYRIILLLVVVAIAWFFWSRAEMIHTFMKKR